MWWLLVLALAAAAAGASPHEAVHSFTGANPDVHNLVIATTTDSMLDLTRNMLCSLAAVSDDSFGVLLAVMDGSCDSYALLVADFPFVCAELPIGIPVSKTDVDYHRKEYWDVNHKRFAIVTDMFHQAKASGLAFVLHTDVDIVFLRSPFHLDLSSAPVHFLSDNGVPNGGFYYVNLKETNMALFECAKTNLANGRTSDGGDQGAIAAALETGDYPYAFLSPAIALNGRALFTIGPTTASVAGHANWIFNSREKIKCLMRSHLWYHDDGVCYRPRAFKLPSISGQHGPFTCL